MKFVAKAFKSALWTGIYVVFGPCLFLLSGGRRAITRLTKRADNRLNVVWGADPLINIKYWSQAVNGLGHKSVTFVTNVYPIHNQDDFDIVLANKYGKLPTTFKYLLATCEIILKFDVVVTSFDGMFLGRTAFWRFDVWLFKLAGIKLIVIPYGGDAYVYNRLRMPMLNQALLVSYPAAARKQQQIARRLDFWCQRADAVVGNVMTLDGFGRWDVLVPSALFIDLSDWKSSRRSNNSDGTSQPVVIAHAPNHRGFKGTEYILEAIKQLQAEGLKIEVKLLEKVKNSEVKRVLYEEVDILVEQLIAVGHGLSGLEGLATGLPVVANLEDPAYTDVLRAYSFLDECPIFSANYSNIKQRLRTLITNPILRDKLGKAGRSYAEKYHGLDSAQFFFENLFGYVYGKQESLLLNYHPLLGEYPKRKPRIEHPLVNNRIVD